VRFVGIGLKIPHGLAVISRERKEPQLASQSNVILRCIGGTIQRRLYSAQKPIAGDKSLYEPQESEFKGLRFFGDWGVEKVALRAAWVGAVDFAVLPLYAISCGIVPLY
jgi:hypothetical protein